MHTIGLSGVKDILRNHLAIFAILVILVIPAISVIPKIKERKLVGDNTEAPAVGIGSAVAVAQGKGFRGGHFFVAGTEGTFGIKVG